VKRSELGIKQKTQEIIENPPDWGLLG